MADRSARVTLATNMWPSAEEPYAGIFVREQVEALRREALDWHFDVVELGGRRGRADYLRGIPRLRRASRTCDLLHAHYGLTGTAAALALTGRPLVVTLHGSDVNIGWQREISRVGVARAAAVLVASERMRSLLGRSDARVLPSGVDVQRFRPLDPTLARERLELPASAPIVLFPADPANPLKEYGLFHAAVEDLRATLPVREHVLGAVPRERMPVLLSAVDVVVLTSGSEGSPMVVKEALSCGTPVVSVDVGDVARLLRGLPGCAVVERTSDAVARGVRRALDSRSAEARAARRRRVQESGLDSRSVARRVLRVYGDVLAHARAGGGHSTG